MSAQHRSRPYMPKELWPKRCRDYSTVDVQLRDGSILTDLFVSPDGTISGKLAPYPVELDEQAVYGLKSEDIIAFRFSGGIAAKLGLKKWHRKKQVNGP